MQGNCTSSMILLPVWRLDRYIFYCISHDQWWKAKTLCAMAIYNAFCFSEYFSLILVQHLSAHLTYLEIRGPLCAQRPPERADTVSEGTSIYGLFQ